MGVDLTEAQLVETKLVTANLVIANLTGASLKGANLNKANLAFAVLTGADLSAIPVNETFKRREEQFATLAEWLDIHLDVSWFFEEI